MTARYFLAVLLVFFLGGTSIALPVGAQTAKETVQRVVEGIWNQKKLELSNEFFHPGFVNHDSNPGAVFDLDGFREWVARWHAAFPDFHVEVHDLVAEGDRVAARLTATGTHRGDFLGVPATGLPVTMKIINFYRLDGDRIAEVYRSYDLLGLGQQLGYYEPLPEEVFPLSPVRRTQAGDFVWGAPSDVTGDMGDPESNKALCVREIEEGWNRGDAAAALAVIAPTFVFHSTYPEAVDFEGYRRWIGEHIDPDNPTRITVTDMIAEKDRVVDLSVAHLEGGMAESGIRISRFADGRIVEMWRNLNVLPILIRLGLLPTFPELMGR